MEMHFLHIAPVLFTELYHVLRSFVFIAESDCVIKIRYEKVTELRVDKTEGKEICSI